MHEGQLLVNVFCGLLTGEQRKILFEKYFDQELKSGEDMILGLMHFMNNTTEYLQLRKDTFAMVDQELLCKWLGEGCPELPAWKHQYDFQRPLEGDLVYNKDRSPSYGRFRINL